MVAGRGGHPDRLPRFHGGRGEEGRPGGADRRGRGRLVRGGRSGGQRQDDGRRNGGRQDELGGGAHGQFPFPMATRQRASHPMTRPETRPVPVSTTSSSQPRPRSGPVGASDDGTRSTVSSSGMPGAVRT